MINVLHCEQLLVLQCDNYLCGKNEIVLQCDYDHYRK